MSRFYIWPRYALEVDGKRIVFPGQLTGAALARLYRVAGHFVSTKYLVEAAYFDDPEGGPLVANQCIRVTLHRVRAILAKVGVTVEGRQGTGFRIVLPR